MELFYFVKGVYMNLGRVGRLASIARQRLLREEIKKTFYNMPNRNGAEKCANLALPQPFFLSEAEKLRDLASGPNLVTHTAGENSIFNGEGSRIQVRAGDGKLIAEGYAATAEQVLAELNKLELRESKNLTQVLI